MLETLPLKAVLWDLDGVIADSFEGHFHARRQRFDGMGLKQAVASSVPE